MARDLGVKPSVLYHRFDKMTIEEALDITDNLKGQIYKEDGPPPNLCDVYDNPSWGGVDF